MICSRHPFIFMTYYRISARIPRQKPLVEQEQLTLFRTSWVVRPIFGLDLCCSCCQITWCFSTFLDSVCGVLLRFPRQNDVDVHLHSHLFGRGFIFYLYHLFLFSENTGVQLGFPIRRCPCCITTIQTCRKK